jgi:hypothetical protein
MNDRRNLIDGLRPAAPGDPAVEQQFVYGQKNPEQTPSISTDHATPVQRLAPSGRPGRSPVSTRIRSDYAEALKRASLERQLKGENPSTVQDILEAALEPWLKKHGYIE